MGADYAGPDGLVGKGVSSDGSEVPVVSVDAEGYGYDASVGVSS